MTKRLILVCLFSLWATVAGAAETYFVATTGNNSRTCAQAKDITTPKLTVENVLDNCAVGGDTVYVRAGSYNENIYTKIPKGISNTERTVISAYSNEAVTINLTNANHGIYISYSGAVASGNITLYGIDWTRSAATGNLIKIEGSTSLGHTISNVTVEGPPPVSGAYKCKVRNNPKDGFNVQGPTSNIIFRNCELYNNGVAATSSPYGHGGYFQRVTGLVFEGNYVHGNGCNGIQIYLYTQNAIVRKNVFADNHVTTQCGTDLLLSNSGHLVEDNIFYLTSGSGSQAIASRFGASAPTDQTIRGNTIVGSYTNCIDLAANSARISVINNILLCNGSVNNLGTNNTLTTNLTSGVQADLFTDPNNRDYTKKAGSAAIDTGTSTGLTFCGTAKDRGAYEVPKITAASISGNVMLVTICNIAPPIQPGTFTVGCTGTGCGTPTVTSTALLEGSGGIVRLETSVTCDVSQTWTVSGGTTSTDSGMIGNGVNQPLHTTTNFPVDSSACDGTGGSTPPVSEEASYAFEGDCVDSSGNGNTCTPSNTSFTAGRTGQGILTVAGVDSHIDTGLLSGHDPSATHLVVAAWVYIDPANLGQTKDIWGVPTGTNQRFLFYRHSGNTWRMSIGVTSGTASEFPVVSGWTHGCLKMNPTGDIATMYINGVAGTVEGASVISGYGSYVFAGDLRFGLPSGFAVSLSGAHIIDDAYIYTSDVSCVDLFNAGTPTPPVTAATQAGHQWQGVYVTGAGVAENRGAADTQRTVVKGGVAAVMVQINNETGSTIVVQPRFRYNINGGEFTNVVPDSPTADGIYYWGSSTPSGLNNGVADGPISGALTHTDGSTLTTSAAVPTLEMADDASYTLRGIFVVDAAVGDDVCWKVFDQGGSALVSTPAAGACLTVLPPSANASH